MNDESHLIRAMRRRERSAWAAMYDRHVGDNFGVIYHLLGGDRGAAEEVNQDVWMLAIEQFDRFDPGRGAFRDWLLGIARIVDRIPPDVVDRVLAGLKAGRVRFDAYRGIMDWNDGSNARRVWRKGRKWRVEMLIPKKKDGTAIPRDADAAWWKAHQSEFLVQLQAVCDSQKVYYYCAEGSVFAPGLTEPPPLKRTMTQAINPPDDPLIPWPDVFAEHTAGYSNVWQSDDTRGFLLDAKPTDGPSGTIFLRVRETHPPGPAHPDLYKLWLDPTKGFLVPRSEMAVVSAAPASKVACVETRVTEGLTRSPLGTWYPARIRRKTSDRNAEQVWTYHLDFDVAIPDTLFQPPA